jgi:hypothetical protein
MDLQPDMKVVAAASQLSTEVQGETVILELDRGVYFSVSKVGDHIWHLLSEPRRIDDLVESVTDAFDVDDDTCRPDVLSFVSELMDAGLVHVVD